MSQYDSNVEGLSQTQERKLWKDILNGNEESISWNKLLITFSEQIDHRQQIALKKIPLDAFSTILHNVEAARVARESEFEAVKLRKAEIAQVMELMASLRVSVTDLQSPVKSEPKVKASKTAVHKLGEGISVSERMVYDALAASADSNGVQSESMNDIALSLGMTRQQVSARIKALELKCFAERVSRGVYRVAPLPKGIATTHRFGKKS